METHSTLLISAPQAALCIGAEFLENEGPEYFYNGSPKIDIKALAVSLKEELNKLGGNASPEKVSDRTSFYSRSTMVKALDAYLNSALPINKSRSFTVLSKNSFSRSYIENAKNFIATCTEEELKNRIRRPFEILNPKAKPRY